MLEAVDRLHPGRAPVRPRARAAERRSGATRACSPRTASRSRPRTATSRSCRTPTSSGRCSSRSRGARSCGTAGATPACRTAPRASTSSTPRSARSPRRAPRRSGWSCSTRTTSRACASTGSKTCPTIRTCAVGFFEQREHPTEQTYTSLRHPVTFSVSDTPFRHHPPRLGQDGRAVLAEAGLGEGEIERMLAEGALTLPGDIDPRPADRPGRARVTLVRAVVRAVGQRLGGEHQEALARLRVVDDRARIVAPSRRRPRAARRPAPATGAWM